MHSPGMYGQRQQILVLEKCIVKVESITDDHILRAEGRARKVTAIGTAKNFDQVFLAFEVTHQLMYQLNVHHKASDLRHEGNMHILRRSKLQANDESTVLLWGLVEQSV